MAKKYTGISQNFTIKCAICYNRFLFKQIKPKFRRYDSMQPVHQYKCSTVHGSERRDSPQDRSTLLIASMDGSVTGSLEITSNTTVGDFVEALRKMEALRLEHFRPTTEGAQTQKVGL